MTYQPWGSSLSVPASQGTDPAVDGIGQDRFAIAWGEASASAGDGSGSAIRLMLYDPFGSALTASPVLVNTAVALDQSHPQVLGLQGGSFVVAWQDASGSGDSSGTGIKGQLFSGDGQKIGGEFLVNTAQGGDQAGVALARDGAGFVAAWQDGGNNAGNGVDLRFQVFDASGGKVGAETLVGASLVGTQASVKAADTPGGFALAWTSDTDANGVIDAIHLQSYASDGTLAGNEATVLTGGTSLASLVDLARMGSSGGLALLYTDLSQAQPAPHYLLDTFTSSGIATGGPFHAGWSMSGYFVQGEALASWQGVSYEPAAFVRGETDGLLNFSDVYLAAIGSGGLSEDSTLQRTQPASGITVDDAAMLEDGRIVFVTHDGTLHFTLADGRGASDGAYLAGGPAVVVGADAGADADNVLVGSAHADTLYGLGGNDYLYGFGGDDVLVGGLGNDVLLGGDGNDTLYGGDGNDYLYGGPGTNVYVGEGGNDVMITDPASRNDTLYGGDGDDAFYLFASGGTTVAIGEAGNDIFAVEGAGAMIAYGGDGQDYFYGGPGDDQMHGGAGVDVLGGGGGNDYYDGGPGVDYLFLGSGHDTVVMNLQSGVDVVNNFDVAHDVLLLQGTAFGNVAQVQAATTDYGSFSVVTIDAQTAVWLVGVTPDQLTATNVLFA